MKNKLLWAYSSAIILVFVYASLTGWTVWHSVKSGTWGPQGRSAYHK